MEIRSADFVASYPKQSQCPQDGRPEFAFIGRSNVGKSSLINMLTAKKGLAKVSGTPGKTRLLNFFAINGDRWYLVDLPGYGYARVSKSEQKNLKSMIDTYLRDREPMVLAFVLIDSTLHPPSRIDLDFINGLGELSVPFVLVFTKCDRIGGTTLQQNIDAFMGQLAQTWETLPQYFVTSSERRTGRDELLLFIEKTLKKIKNT
jgi:GTP-binding protein